MENGYSMKKSDAKDYHRFCNMKWLNDLFVCFGVYHPTQEILTHMETSPLPLKSCKFWPMLGTHGHWGFFSVPHLLWQGASVYNGHLRGPKTLTPVAGHLAVKLSLPVFTTWVCRDWDSNSQHSACEANALTHYATATVVEWCLL